jgi:hypothetical protein
MKSTKCWQSSRLKGKAPAPSSAPIWLQTAHAQVVADRLGLVRRPRGRRGRTGSADRAGFARCRPTSVPSFGGIGSTQSFGGRRSFRPLVGIGVQPFGGRGSALSAQPFSGRAPQTPTGGGGRATTAFRPKPAPRGACELTQPGSEAVAKSGDGMTSKSEERHLRPAVAFTRPFPVAFDRRRRRQS